MIECKKKVPQPLSTFNIYIPIKIKFVGAYCSTLLLTFPSQVQNRNVQYSKKAIASKVIRLTVSQSLSKMIKIDLPTNINKKKQ